MRATGLITALGFALPQLVSADGQCCRTGRNACYRAIVEPVNNGLEGCSSNLIATVTPSASTVIEPVLVTDVLTVTATALFSETSTVVASTETLLFTESTTVTASTQTDIVVETLTTPVTATTILTTSTTVTTTSTVSPATLTARDAADLPPYAMTCGSWDKYVSACSCAGVTSTTVTLPTPVVTVSVPDVQTVSTTGATISSTETATSSGTTTTSNTETSTIVLTATTSTTQTSIIVSTTTTSTTSIATATQTSTVGVCGPYKGPFKAVATQYNNSPLLIYANLLNGLTGGITWNAASGSTAAAVQNKYIWSIDNDGYLNVAYNVPPYSYKYYAYMSTASTGSNWPQLNTEASVRSQVNAGGRVTYVKACVNSVTGELQLNAAGRTYILWCGQQLWMSYTPTGADINRGTCVQMFPKIQPV